MGFEPTTPALRKRCSTAELGRPILDRTNLCLQGSFERSNGSLAFGSRRTRCVCLPYLTNPRFLNWLSTSLSKGSLVLVAMNWMPRCRQ